MHFRGIVSLLLPVFLFGCAYPYNELARQDRVIEDIQTQQASHYQKIAGLESDMSRIQSTLESLREETAQRLMDLEFMLAPEAAAPGPMPDQEEYRFEQGIRTDVSQVIPEDLKIPEPAKDRPVKSPELPGNEQADYKKALELYYAEHPEQSRNAFQQFIDRYPQSELQPNAWYWLAETYYMEKDYPRAILSFRQVLEKFPEDPKAPDSLLKIGYAYERLEDFRNALFYLGILVQDYPDSSAARRASGKVQELRNKV